MKKQILKRILSSISATTLAVTSLGLNTVLAANAESAAPAAQTKEHTEAADHVHDDCCGGCCGEEAPAGQGVTIALLDAGVTNYETAGKTSFIDDDTIDSDHGNDMMSILKDTAPGADVLDVRVLDDEGKGTYANVEKGIRWAVDNSADIIVMSFVGDKKSALLENALTYAEEHEVLVVASAGNYSSEKACYPAAYPTVISVGALDENGNVQDYSNFGDYVDTFVEWSDGTSGAAQNVAAFAAITMQQSPEKSASDIRETYVADKSTSFEASKEDNADTVVYAAKCTSHRYKFKMTARAATCTTGGVEIWVCANYGCSASQTRNTKALGHNAGNWTREKNPTCTATGSDVRKCTRCGAVVNRRTLSALGHNPGNWTREKNPTCTANGSDIRKCTRCGAVVNRRTLSALGHNPGNWTREKNPTCTTNGSDIRKCTRCNAVVNRRTVNKLGHNPGNWTREKNPTCTATGSDIRKCTRCGAVVNRRTLSALGHNPGNWTREKNPTCTANGSDIRKCTRCKAIVSRRTVNKLGHNPGNWTREKNPTCTVDGSDIRKCTRCKAIVSRRTVNKLGHNPGNWIREKNPTCTTNGSEIRKCIRCGAVVSRRTIAAPGHYFKFKQTAKPATCTTGGVEIWACTRSGCKATQTRNTKALGHSYKWVVTKQPTCTATGVKQYKCSRSGCGHVANSAAVPALGHNFKLKQVVKQATCTTAGVEIWACTRSGCKATQTKNIKALGHDLTAWKIITPATTTTEGKKERSCKRSGCKYKETAVIPKIGTLTVDDCGFSTFYFHAGGTLDETQCSYPLYGTVGGKTYLKLKVKSNVNWTVSASQSFIHFMNTSGSAITSGKSGESYVLVKLDSIPVTSDIATREGTITIKANDKTKTYKIVQVNRTFEGLKKADYIKSLNNKIGNKISTLSQSSRVYKILRGDIITNGNIEIAQLDGTLYIAVSSRFENSAYESNVIIEYMIFKAAKGCEGNAMEPTISIEDNPYNMKLKQGSSPLLTCNLSVIANKVDVTDPKHDKVLKIGNAIKFPISAAMNIFFATQIPGAADCYAVAYTADSILSNGKDLIVNLIRADKGKSGQMEVINTVTTYSLNSDCEFSKKGDRLNLHCRSLGRNTRESDVTISFNVVNSLGRSTPFTK